jgi:hypothetical protein
MFCARRPSKEAPTPGLSSIRPLFGELGEDRLLVEPVRDWLQRLYGAGIQATLDEAARCSAGR